SPLRLLINAAAARSQRGCLEAFSRTATFPSKVPLSWSGVSIQRARRARKSGSPKEIAEGADSIALSKRPTASSGSHKAIHQRASSIQAEQAWEAGRASGTLSPKVHAARNRFLLANASEACQRVSAGAWAKSRERKSPEGRQFASSI